MDVQEARTWGRSRLASARPDIPSAIRALECDVLIAACLGISADLISTARTRGLSTQQEECCRAFIERRAGGEPVAYLLGAKEFFGRDFIVSPAVLIPRPETEFLVDRTLELLRAHSEPCRVIDVGTGSGCIVCSVVAEQLAAGKSVEKLQFIAVDNSSEALEVAKRNAEQLGLLPHISFVLSDLLSDSQLQPQQGLRDIIVSNPPYIPQAAQLPDDVALFEPASALRSGEDGLDHIRALLLQFLKRDSADLLLEIGDGQDHALQCLLSEQGVRQFQFIKDLQGINRVVEVRGSA